MPDFTGEDLRGSRFEEIDLRGAHFRAIDMSGARFGSVDMTDVVMRGVDLVNMDIHGHIENLTINGVDIAPLVTAELDRRYPLRPKMRPTDPAGFREAWSILERLWGETIDRARGLPPDRLHESVNGEWSFIEMLRHLAFVTDSWMRRAILGDPSPWNALDLPWDEMPDVAGVPRDRSARPSLQEALKLRRGRMSTVYEFLDGLTVTFLESQTEPVEGPGWPQPRSYPVSECLLTILNEEWVHRLHAERDLEILEARPR